LKRIEPVVSPALEIGHVQTMMLLSTGSEPSLGLDDVFTSSASSHSLPSIPGHRDVPNEASTPRPVEKRTTPEPKQSFENTVGPPSSLPHKTSFGSDHETKKETSNLQAADRDTILQGAAPRYAFAFSSPPGLKTTAARELYEIPNLTVGLLPVDTKTARTNVPAISEEEREKEQTKKEFERIKAIEKLEEARREAVQAKRLLYADFENTVALTSMPPPLLDTKTLVLLISKRAESHAQRANQARAHTILSSHGLKYGVVDGSDPESEKWRDELLELSGMRNTYPQLFLIDDENVEFLGDFNKLLEMNESGLLNGSLIEKPQEEVKHRWQPHRGQEEPPKTGSDNAFAEAESAHARFGIAAFEAEMKLQEEISQLRAEMARKEKVESEVRNQLAAQLVKLKAREAHQQETQSKAKQLLEDAVKKRASEEKRRKVAEKARKQAESELVRQQTLLKELREREEAEMTRIRSDEDARRNAEKEARHKREEEIRKRLEAEARIDLEEAARRAAELELERLRGILHRQESSQEARRNVNATLAIQKTIKALREAETTATQKAEEEARLRAEEAKRRLEMERARKKAELELLRLKKDIVRKQKIDKLRAEEEAEMARERFHEEKRLRLLAEQELEKLRAATSSSNRENGNKSSRKENLFSNAVVASAEMGQRAAKPRDASLLSSLPRARSATRKATTKDDHRLVVSESPIKDPTTLRRLRSMEEKLQQLKEAKLKLKQEQAKALKREEKQRVKSPPSSRVANHEGAVPTGENARLLAMQTKLAKLKARQARSLLSTS
jgi:hypothetical protein